MAQIMSNSFEPVWEMVRPVPLVRIDFGNGNIVTRTLHGNIATYVCIAEGQVLDVLPGIYSPSSYLESLRQLSLLAKYVSQAVPEQRGIRLADYHRTQAENLQKNQPPARIVNIAAMSKRAIEGGVKLALMPGTATDPTRANSPAADDELPLASEDLANWKLLAEDTRINECVRRLQIHQQLAKGGGVRPQALVKWLYKDVLHADLDDPYLGLGNVLFANYPFQKEDSAQAIP